MERRTLTYSIILALFGVALAVVGMLILRKRDTLTGAGIQRQTPRQPAARKAAPAVRPLDSYVPAPAWKAGDPVFQDTSKQELKVEEEVENLQP